MPITYIQNATYNFFMGPYCRLLIYLYSLLFNYVAIALPKAQNILTHFTSLMSLRIKIILPNISCFMYCVLIANM